MMLSAKIFAYFLVSLLVFIAIIETAPEQISPVPVEVTQPEQSHYAVFYFICGTLQHILMTTQPPLRHSMEKVPSQEMLDLLKATPKERIIELRYAGSECFYNSPPQAPKESI